MTTDTGAARLPATPRVLIAEDDEPLASAVRAIEHGALRYLENAVTVVRDGEQALDYLYRRGAFEGRSNQDPVLVLLDLKMPKVDGFEVLRTIKSDERLKSTPVVVLTSSREEKDLVSSYALGVNAYVVKPVDFDGFMGAVRELGLFWLLVNVTPPRVEKEK